MKNSSSGSGGAIKSKGRIFSLMVAAALGMFLAWKAYMWLPCLFGARHLLVSNLTILILSLPVLFILWYLRTYDTKKQIKEVQQSTSTNLLGIYLGLLFSENLDARCSGLVQLIRLRNKGSFRAQIDLATQNINLFTENHRINLSFMDLQNANLHQIVLTGANLKKANLTNANLTDSSLEKASLISATLISIELNGANLVSANLTDANLTNANLTDANLTDANLTDANLTDANLTNANLKGAKLKSANLKDADLTGANLTGANLTDADLTNANLTNAEYDSNTKFPDKFNSKRSEMMETES